MWKDYKVKFESIAQECKFVLSCYCSESYSQYIWTNISLNYTWTLLLKLTFPLDQPVISSHTPSELRSKAWMLMAWFLDWKEIPVISTEPLNKYKIPEYQRLNWTNFNSPVTGCFVVNSNCAIGKGITKPTTIHGAKRGDDLQEITHKNKTPFHRGSI